LTAFDFLRSLGSKLITRSFLSTAQIYCIIILTVALVFLISFIPFVIIFLCCGQRLCLSWSGSGQRL